MDSTNHPIKSFKQKGAGGRVKTAGCLLSEQPSLVLSTAPHRALLVSSEVILDHWPERKPRALSPLPDTDF